MRRFLPIALCMLSLPLTNEACAQPVGYGYGRSITINGAQVTGSLTNFPVLVSVTLADLRTTANGGQVRNANGYDIVFTTSGCNTTLTYERERYVASTGEFIA
jgi:hypothetical protein